MFVLGHLSSILRRRVPAGLVFLLPPSVYEWLPQRHLARFVVEVIDGLGLTSMEKAGRW